MLYVRSRLFTGLGCDKGGGRGLATVDLLVESDAGGYSRIVARGQEKRWRYKEVLNNYRFSFVSG